MIVTSEQIEKLKALLKKESERRKQLKFLKAHFKSELVDQIEEEEKNDI